MRLKVLIFFLQVVLGESSREVLGYLGDNVTLPSGADPSWKLTTIEWEIFPNSTFIATYRGGKPNTLRFHQYIGRLHLDITSGDLKISNVTRKDDMKYTVKLVHNNTSTENSIKLTVRQRLQKPTIRTQTFLQNGPVRTGCWVEARCSSSDEGVDFSWQVSPSNATSLNISSSGGSSALLLAFINSSQVPVSFTCITSKTNENTDSVATAICQDEQTPITAPPLRDRCGAIIASAIFTGFLLGIILLLFCGEQKHTAREQGATVAEPGTSASDAETSPCLPPAVCGGSAQQNVISGSQT